MNLINRSKALQDIVEYADKITTQRFGWEELRRVAWDIYRIVASQPGAIIKTDMPNVNSILGGIESEIIESETKIEDLHIWGDSFYEGYEEGLKKAKAIIEEERDKCLTKETTET